MGAAEKATMAVVDDMGEGMQCSDHPYRKNPGGICAFCLQEKLGKLVSSSNNSTPPFSANKTLGPSSSSSPTSFRSDYGTGTMGPTATRINGSVGGGNGRAKMSFLSVPTTTTQNNKNGSGVGGKVNASSSSSSSSGTAAMSNNVMVLKRSKSVAPGPTDNAATTTTPRKKSFWSFFYISSNPGSAISAVANSGGSSKRRSTSNNKDLKCEKQAQEQTNKVEGQETAIPESPGTGSQASSSSFGRKVARSRSVGCGSRSFSGDFLERISTGFGDCTLRRVESHRENNSCNKKVGVLNNQDGDQRIVKDRVKCGGIFGGFGMISTSSSYWLSAAAASGEDDEFDGRISGSNTARASATSMVRGGRTRSWSWAFASPMRAFKPSTTSSSSSASASNAITSINAKVGVNPSLLAVGVK